MKKVICFLFVLVVCYGESSFAQKLNTLTIQLNNEKTFVSSTNDLDSITYDTMSDEGNIIQMIWEKDSLYRIPLQDIESTVFAVIDIPEMVVVKQNIGEWDDIRFCNDGSIIAHKNYAGSDIPECVVIASENPEHGNIMSAIAYKEDGTPKFIGINDYCIILDSIYNDSVDLMVVYKDSIALCYKGLTFSDTSLLARQKVIRHAWGQMDWWARTSAILDITIGVAGFAVAGVTISSGIASAMATGGVSVLAGLVVGTSTIVAAKQKIEIGLNKINVIDYQEDDPVNLVAAFFGNGSSLVTDFGIAGQYGVMPNKFTTIGGWAIFIATYISSIFDKYGRTVTTVDRYKYYRFKVLTGVSKDITTQSAILRGYVYPEITRNLLDGKKLENEYGIRLYEGTSSQPVSIHNIVNGEGGMVEYLFDNLKPDTQYNYQTYYLDKTNVLSVFGENKSFRTEELFNCSVILTDFKVTKSQYRKRGFTNDGKTYDYRFDVTIKAMLDDSEGVIDWGYVYRDPNGQEKEISLMQFGTSKIDDRYAYFRNENPSSVCLFGFVKYAGSDETVYGEPQYFDLIYEEVSLCPDENHPHMIDLGLPSGTKWACCNLGAAKPEDYGNYYSYDEACAISLPTWNQMNEMNVCYDKSGYYKGVSGDFYKGPNGASIFIPFAGWFVDGKLEGERRSHGLYYYEDTPNALPVGVLSYNPGLSVPQSEDYTKDKYSIRIVTK